jgi:hypothetical protein
MINGNTKIVLIVAFALLLIYAYQTFNSPKPTKKTSESKANEGFEESVEQIDKLPENAIEKPTVAPAKESKPKKAAPKKAAKKAAVDEWDTFFKDTNQLTGEAGAPGDFQPVTGDFGDFAPFQGTGKKAADMSPEELFDAEQMKPQEKKKDWFETIDEPISVENEYLIQVTRPQGVDTIGTSRKGAGHDLRGTPPCPKFAISPWNNTSITPDTNIRSWDS